MLETPEISDVGAMAYVDPDIDSVQAIDIKREIYRKREAFKHEKEVRFMINTTFKEQNGECLLLQKPPQLYESFDLRILNNPIVHPNAPVET